MKESTKDSLDEKRRAGISYIFSFFSNVSAITLLNAQYNNLLIEFKNKYPDTGISKITDEEKNQLIIAVQKCREYIGITYIQYTSLIGILDQKEDIVVVSAYKKMKQEFIINPDEMEKFVIAMNKILLNDFVQNILQSSQDLVSDVYGKSTEH